ncbi:MAG: hypothetical protein S4CHLAM45_09630 [Chlamydiales bacterium]|nr:hypothetical protein [Chlamydiales bacterium]MCH9620219.1 hypothetical protein [Chlamydiales bacterium]MCH9623066.1 hypothetical protein [Chlamydiales bacterium]
MSTVSNSSFVSVPTTYYSRDEGIPPPQRAKHSFAFALPSDFCSAFPKWGGILNEQIDLLRVARLKFPQVEEEKFESLLLNIYCRSEGVESCTAEYAALLYYMEEENPFFGDMCSYRHIVANEILAPKAQEMRDQHKDIAGMNHKEISSGKKVFLLEEFAKLIILPSGKLSLGGLYAVRHFLSCTTLRKYFKVDEQERMVKILSQLINRSDLISAVCVSGPLACRKMEHYLRLSYRLPKETELNSSHLLRQIMVFLLCPVNQEDGMQNCYVISVLRYLKLIDPIFLIYKIIEIYQTGEFSLDRMPSFSAASLIQETLKEYGKGNFLTVKDARTHPLVKRVREELGLKEEGRVTKSMQVALRRSYARRVFAAQRENVMQLILRMGFQLAGINGFKKVLEKDKLNLVSLLATRIKGSPYSLNKIKSLLAKTLWLQDMSVPLYQQLFKRKLWVVHKGRFFPVEDLEYLISKICKITEASSFDDVDFNKQWAAYRSSCESSAIESEKVDSVVFKQVGGCTGLVLDAFDPSHLCEEEKFTDELHVFIDEWIRCRNENKVPVHGILILNDHACSFELKHGSDELTRIKEEMFEFGGKQLEHEVSLSYLENCLKNHFDSFGTQGYLGKIKEDANGGKITFEIVRESLKEEREFLQDFMKILKIVPPLNDRIVGAVSEVIPNLTYSEVEEICRWAFADEISPRRFAHSILKQVYEKEVEAPPLEDLEIAICRGGFLPPRVTIGDTNWKNEFNKALFQIGFNPVENRLGLYQVSKRGEQEYTNHFRDVKVVYKRLNNMS